MGDVVQLPTGPRAPYFLLAWDQFSNNCRFDFVDRTGCRTHIGSGRDYLSVRDEARRYAEARKLPLVDQIDPTQMRRVGQ